MFSKTIVRCLLVACLALPAAAIGSAQTESRGKLRAGAAKLDITPKGSDLLTPTDVIRDHLFARAIVVDNGITCAVLVGLDLSGVDDQGIQKGISRAAASTGCPAENFLVSATHTHSSSTQGLELGPPSPKQQEDIIVAVAGAAKAKLAPARVGYGTAMVDLNVNRDLSSLKPEERAASNLEYPSDKTLAVVEFIGDDHVPIGVYINYAMHPVNFYQTGVLSGDFPGEAERYLERLFDGRAVAIYSQGAEGDQGHGWGQRAVQRVLAGQDLVERFGAPAPPTPSAQQAATQHRGGAKVRDDRGPVRPEKLEEYKRAIEVTGANVTMMGAFLGANAVRVMREIQSVDIVRIWGARDVVTCPGRIRDTASPLREDGFPAYKDGPDIDIRVGLLRIGDINFVSVNGEVFNGIGSHVKAELPPKTLVVALANGRAPSGYIYADNASKHMRFEIVGSRLKPGCAEGKIVSKAVELIRRSGE
jgi:neutral ceramidase